MTGLGLLIVATAGCSTTPSGQSSAGSADKPAIIKRLGGDFARDDKRAGNPVIEINLSRVKASGKLPQGLKEVTDADLEDLKEFEELTSLSLSGCDKVTDAGVNALKDLKKLELLDLSHTQVTDAGLRQLIDLKRLTTLGLMGTKVTDAGLKELKGLTQLTSLNLTESKATEAGVKDMKQALPKCEIIFP
jgi:hypothetical protein